MRHLALALGALGLLVQPLNAVSAQPVEIRGKGKPFGFDARTQTVSLPLVQPGPRYRLPEGSAASRLPLDGTSTLPGMSVHADGPYVAYVEVDSRLISPSYRHWTSSMNLSQGLVERVLVAKNRPGIVRIAIRAREPIRLQTHLERHGETWRLAVRPISRPAPSVEPVAAPQPVSVVPETVEPTPEPLPSPELQPIASAEREPILPSAAPVPLPEPLRTPEAAHEARSRFELRRRIISLAEDVPRGGANGIEAAGLGAWELDWLHAWTPRLASRLRLGLWDAYTIQDLDLPNSTHERFPAELSVALQTESAWGALRLSPYAGATLRRVQVVNSFESLAPMYVFSSQAAYFGPEIGSHAALPLWGPLNLVGTAFVRPVTWLWLDPGVPSVGPLMGAGGTLGLELTQGPLLARLELGSEVLRGMTTRFRQDFWPPSLGLSVGYRY